MIVFNFELKRSDIVELQNILQNINLIFKVKFRIDYKDPCQKNKQTKKK